ncbi:unnamed protein product [Cercospora beticola]|nr:unnamed protein product [Cercospora beticola]
MPSYRACTLPLKLRPPLRAPHPTPSPSRQHTTSSSTITRLGSNADVKHRLRQGARLPCADRPSILTTDRAVEQNAPPNVSSSCASSISITPVSANDTIH